MRINGEWHWSESGGVTPRVQAEIRTRDGNWLAASFLLDTGAERSVFTYDVLDAVQLDPEPSDGTYLVGVGGTSATILVATKIRMQATDGQWAPVKGVYYAFTDPISLDLCILGRDVLSNFAVIVDRPGNQILLLARDHRYHVMPAVS